MSDSHLPAVPTEVGTEKCLDLWLQFCNFNTWCCNMSLCFRANNMHIWLKKNLLFSAQGESYMSCQHSYLLISKYLCSNTGELSICPLEQKALQQVGFLTILQFQLEHKCIFILCRSKIEHMIFVKAISYKITFCLLKCVLTLEIFQTYLDLWPQFQWPPRLWFYTLAGCWLPKHNIIPTLAATFASLWAIYLFIFYVFCTPSHTLETSTQRTQIFVLGKAEEWFLVCVVHWDHWVKWETTCSPLLGLVWAQVRGCIWSILHRWDCSSSSCPLSSWDSQPLRAK